MPAIPILPAPGLRRRWPKLPGAPDGESGVGLADGGEPCTGYDRFNRTEPQIRYTNSDGTIDERIAAGNSE